MLARVLVILAVSGLAACSGGSGSNPFGSLGSLNPFGRGERAQAAAVEARAAVGPGVLVERLDSVQPEPALRGLILRATGTAPMQGYHGTTLFAVNEGTPDANGIVTYEFRAFPPDAPMPAGPERSRRLIAATFVPDDDLAGVRGFRVIARGNSVDLRR